MTTKKKKRENKKQKDPLKSLTKTGTKHQLEKKTRKKKRGKMGTMASLT